ncbi:aminotransferase class III-fold pyridoxal phosphate-dependent enzyme (plasmid) [Gemmobacter fulvus]|uniref:Aminotransferase class III-fold pyridoxal phosphate-dependent enzyme n=1 Tax=Gemmobacter fulvus TaxID=2840474 RepID=A0A975P9Z6_9RHOB|nr:aminotransferase [Gemmobacter fulvus]MBT9246092.1 aminotransferase class III-fold pyridoxal phosphate-dependent enzyme [Gemmobacter fulvus]QWK92147.1 aminotransferase class III-fold pyridoxal phosphate-dependent enzyme [Gemmobacter fulvus]
MLSNSLRDRDIASQLHPQTNLSLHEKTGPVVMASGQGVEITDTNGKTYIEGMSGLWCTALGLSESRLAEAATRQMGVLPYYQNFAHRATEPGIQLAETLLEIAPVPMSKVLFQSSGSEANDTAIKLVWYHFAAQGRPEKRKIIGRNRGYHGTSIASASITGLPHLHRDFHLPLPNFLHVTCPHFYREGKPDETEEQFSTRLANELDALIIAEGPDTVAAFFAEPAMGTGGAVMPPKGYFEKIQKVLKKHEVLLIADEVITGFGRTGNWWGCQTFGVEPDMITCAKALTAAYMPLSALLISEPVYQSMKAQSEKIGVFGHGYTYGAHPVACAVANEALRIYEEDGIIAGVAAKGAQLGGLLTPLADHPLVGEVRGTGLMWGIEIVADKVTRAPFDPARAIPAKVQEAAFAQGLVCRALGSAIAIAPPLVIRPDQIDAVHKRFSTALDQIADELGIL